MLITDTYRAQNAAMHVAKPHYGNGGHYAAPQVERVAEQYGAKSILDYGCGKGRLAEALPHLPIVGYDPAIPGKDGWPSAADLVVCRDVMEHIEPECLDAVLGHLCCLTRKALYIEVATVPAFKHLPDGRNAHLIVEPMSWWLARISPLFNVAMTVEGEKDFVAILEPRGAQ